MLRKSIICIFVFICTTAIYLNSAIAACTTSADCPTGYYCRQQAPSMFDCALCTNKPDNAEYSNHGTGTNENNCPWACKDGYSGSTCEDCATNYYKDGHKCYKCPYDSTTVSGNTTDCFWSTNYAVADKHSNTTGTFVNTTTMSHATIVPVSNSVKTHARNSNTQ